MPEYLWEGEEFGESRIVLHPRNQDDSTEPGTDKAREKHPRTGYADYES